MPFLECKRLPQCSRCGNVWIPDFVLKDTSLLLLPEKRLAEMIGRCGRCKSTAWNSTSEPHFRKRSKPIRAVMPAYEDDDVVIRGRRDPRIDRMVDLSARAKKEPARIEPQPGKHNKAKKAPRTAPKKQSRAASSKRGESRESRRKSRELVFAGIDGPAPRETAVMIQREEPEVTKPAPPVSLGFCRHRLHYCQICHRQDESSHESAGA